MISRAWSAAALVAAMSIGSLTAADQLVGTPAETVTRSTSSATTATTADLTTPTETDPSTVDTAALEAIDTDARFAVAVLDVASGSSSTYGDAGTFDTASVVKVDILAALLSQNDGEVTEDQQQLAAAMIEHSDNDAATELFDTVGGESGLEAYNDTIGLTDTTVSSSWGLTQTTPSDQLIVLQAALRYDLVVELMGQVVDAQNFGVSAAADDADDAVLKVGYLPRSSSGLWDVTSIGRIESGGRTYLMAVLSDGNASFDDGVALVDAVAAAAVPTTTSA